MEKLNFEKAFKYPFNRAKGMLNILWILVPIVGWFALIGYNIRIVKEFTENKFEKLPIFNFKKDLELGFFMFIKAIPFIIFYTVIMAVLAKISPIITPLVNLFVSLFVVPVLGINFVNKQTVNSFFEFKILNQVFSNLKDYFIALVKSFVLGVIFFIMWIILVGIPAGTFTKNIFLADFYRRKIKK